MQALTVFVRGWICVGLLVVGPAAALGQPAPADPLTRARQFYNAGRYDEAVTAAREAIARPGTQSEANLLLGRALLERHRTSRTDEDLVRRARRPARGGRGVS